MAYEMMLYPKEKTPQTVPAGSYTSDLYASYAELFDLSLLPNDGEVPLSPQSQLQQNQQQQQQQQQHSSYSGIAGPNNGPAQSPEYIPATIFHDVPSPDAGSMQQLKQEPGSVASVWSDTWSTSSGYLSCSSISGSNPASPESPASSYGLLDHPHTQQQSVPVRGSSLQDHHHQRLLSPYGGTQIEQTIKTEYDSGAETSIDLDSLLGDSPSPYQQQQQQQQQQQHPATVKVEEADLDALLYSFSPSSGLEAQQVPAPVPAPPPASKPQQQQQQGFQILREHLQDTSFQRRHNLKPLELDSLIGGLTTHADIGPVFEYALQEMKNGVQATCTELGISSDPKQWPTAKVHQWLELAMGKYSLPRLDNLGALFPENGAQLAALPLEEFVRRIPQGGDKLHGHLELWKQIHRLMVGDTSMADSSMICDGGAAGAGSIGPLGCTMPNVPNFSGHLASGVVPMMPESGPNGATNALGTTGLVAASTGAPSLTSSTMSPAMVDNFDSDSMNDDISDDDDEDMTVESPGSSSSAGGPSSSSGATTSAGATPKPRHGGSHIHLWQFLKELLACPEQHQNAIRWIDRSKGVFKIEDSVRVARLWGRRKNRPAMNYDKLSRSIRQYYKKGIMQKTERSQRLVYQFCSPYAL